MTYSILGMVADEVAPQGLVGALRGYAEQAGAESVWPVNDTRLPRRGIVHPIRNHRRLHLGVPVSPYGPEAGGGAAEPAFEEEDPFGILRTQVSEWPRLAVPQAPPWVHGVSYSAKQSLRGQTLAAGGFEGSATDLARLFRALLLGASKGGVLSDEVALSLRVIDPAGDPNLGLNECPWCYGYGLGFFLYRNWVIGSGVLGASASLVAYNTAYDITFAWVGNWAGGSPLTLFDDDFFDALETFWPCKEDPQTPREDCPAGFTTVVSGGGAP